VPKPPPVIEKPKVVVNDVGNEVIEEGTEPKKDEKLTGPASTAPKGTPTEGRDKSNTVVIIFVIIGVVVVAIVVALIIYFIRKSR
jgi:hypothetical protein